MVNNKRGEVVHMNSIPEILILVHLNNLTLANSCFDRLMPRPFSSEKSDNPLNNERQKKLFNSLYSTCSWPLNHIPFI